jgi:S-adenosylmethionine decarboxylase
MWGKHLVLDCAGCPRDLISDKENIRRFVDELILAIDMVPVGEPKIEYLAGHVPHLAGYSMVQLIETSSITGHFCDDSREVYLDVFSCKDFDPEMAVTVVCDFFEPEAWGATVLVRDASLHA